MGFPRTCPIASLFDPQITNHPSHRHPKRRDPSHPHQGTQDQRESHVPRRWWEWYGIDGKLFDWSDEITADCPRK
jgi:hypothetical protein